MRLLQRLLFKKLLKLESRYYPKFKIVRTVVLYGSNNERVAEIEVGFLLNERGKLVLGVRAPKLFTKAITNLLTYWS